MNCIIEIGANTGKDTKSLASRGLQLFAFEPNPALYNDLVEKFKHENNVLILPFAVDIQNGISDFHVYLQGDKGLGSLYEFNHNLPNTVMKNIPEFQVPAVWKQKVLTMRLDTFILNWNITSIEYLWIDAQGNDFNCIKSLGDKIDLVKEGNCECIYEISLYENANNYYQDVINYLIDEGMQTEISYTHSNNTEVDLKFHRKT